MHDMNLLLHLTSQIRIAANERTGNVLNTP